MVITIIYRGHLLIKLCQLYLWMSKNKWKLISTLMRLLKFKSKLKACFRMLGIFTCWKYLNKNRIKCQLLVLLAPLQKLYSLIVKLAVLCKNMTLLSRCFWSSMLGSFLFCLEPVRIISRFLSFIGFVMKCPILWRLLRRNMGKLLEGILHYLGTQVRNTGQLTKQCKVLFFLLIWDKDTV